MGHILDMPAGSKAVDASDAPSVPSDRAPQIAPRPLLLYDGECGLCARSVRFILDREKDERLQFAPLQSEVGRRTAEAHGLDPDLLSTLVLVDEQDRAHVRSSAALRAAQHLRWPWRWAPVFLVVPRFVRDGVYRFVAKNRMRWFGGADSCPLPTSEQSRRFHGFDT